MSIFHWAGGAAKSVSDAILSAISIRVFWWELVVRRGAAMPAPIVGGCHTDPPSECTAQNIYVGELTAHCNLLGRIATIFEHPARRSVRLSSADKSALAKKRHG